LIERDLFGTVRLVRNWGRIGTNGQELVEIHADELAAGQALEMIAGEAATRLPGSVTRLGHCCLLVAGQVVRSTVKGALDQVSLPRESQQCPKPVSFGIRRIRDDGQFGHTTLLPWIRGSPYHLARPVP
jgi:hypothetical protein